MLRTLTQRPLRGMIHLEIPGVGGDFGACFGLLHKRRVGGSIPPPASGSREPRNPGGFPALSPSGAATPGGVVGRGGAAEPAVEPAGRATSRRGAGGHFTTGKSEYFRNPQYGCFGSVFTLVGSASARQTSRPSRSARSEAWPTNRANANCHSTPS